MLLPCQKHLFNLDPHVHYLNGAYMSPLLRSAETAGIHGLLRKRQPDKFVASDFFDDPERLRGLFARLVHAASPDEVALVPSVSYGMAIVAKNLNTRKGQKIVVAEAQFPSNVYPWMAVAEERGLRLHIVEMPSEQHRRGQRWNERILDAIDENTALVAIGHIHWANGSRFDLEKISEKTHRLGGLVVVDGTQSVGALDLDVQKFQLDALVCAGYKWLMGPYSTGYAWFGPAFLHGRPIEDNWIGRLHSEDFSRLVQYQSEYQPGARRFDVGERSNFALVPASIAGLEQVLEWGTDAIQAHCRTLTQNAVSDWNRKGFWTEDPVWRAAHLFGIQLPEGLDTQVLQAQLQEKRISVSIRGDFVRVSPHVYNNPSDIAALTDLFASIGG